MLGRFENMARELLGLAGDRACGQQHGGAGGHHLAAREGAEPERYTRRIAGNHADLVGAQAELVGRDLGERGLQALADRGRACEHGDAPGVRHPHDAGFERAAAGALDAVREPDADVAPLAARGRLARGKVAPLRGFEHHRLAGRIVAAVVLHGGAGARLERLGVGHLLGRDEIAAAQLGAVEAELARHAIHHPLHREGGLRIAGAADRGDRRLVGGGDRHVHRQ